MATSSVYWWRCSLQAQLMMTHLNHFNTDNDAVFTEGMPAVFTDPVRIYEAAEILHSLVQITRWVGGEGVEGAYYHAVWTSVVFSWSATAPAPPAVLVLKCIGGPIAGKRNGRIHGWLRLAAR